MNVSIETIKDDRGWNDCKLNGNMDWPEVIIFGQRFILECFIRIDSSDIQISVPQLFQVCSSILVSGMIFFQICFC